MCTTYEGYNLLHLSIIFNSENILVWLIGKNLNIESSYYKNLVQRNTFKKQNIFHIVVKSKNTDVLKKLLMNVNNFNYLFETDVKNRTPFTYAIVKSYFSIADIIFIEMHKHPCNIYIKDVNYFLCQEIFKLFRNKNILKVSIFNLENINNNTNMIVLKYLKNKYFFAKYLFEQIKGNIISSEYEITEINELIIDSNHNQRNNDCKEFMKLNNKEYIQLIKFDKISDYKNSVFPKTGTGTGTGDIIMKIPTLNNNIHPDILVILTRMNANPYMLHAIGYTTNNQGIVDKIIFSSMRHNLRKILKSDEQACELKSEIRLKIIDQLFKAHNSFINEHMFDYESPNVYMSCEDIYLDDNFNIKIKNIEFRVNI